MTVIVMLILAGVSLNALVGDNGIITNAQSANIKNSMAILEEYLQQKYVENYDKFDNDDGKVIQLQKMYPEYFYIPSIEGIGSLRYIVDSGGHALYLIKKSGLPKEIREQLIGGDAGDGKYSDYATLNDVYGVTFDLKVYYSSATGAQLLGITVGDLDNDNPFRTVFKNNSAGSQSEMYSLLNSYDKDENGEISAEEAKIIKEITIDESTALSDFSELYNLVSLQKLIIANKNLTNLEGIQACPNLYYVYFKTCKVSNYSALSGLSKTLKNLYLYDVDDNEFTTLVNGIKNTDFSVLNYFAITGNIGLICDTSDTTLSGKSTNTITTLKKLSELSSITKKSITYLDLKNNNIIDEFDENGKVSKFATEYLSDYTNLYLLRLEMNQLTGLKGLENMNSLAYLFVAKNQLGKYEIYDKTLENDGRNVATDALISLTNKENLVYLNLVNNPDLKWIEYCNLNCLQRFLLAGCNGMIDDSVSRIKSVVNRLSGPDISYPAKYWLSLLDDDTKNLDLNGQTLSVEQFEELGKYSKIEILNLTNLKLSENDAIITNESRLNSIINNTLKKLTKLTDISIWGISMSSIEFVKNTPDLKGIHFWNTKVTTVQTNETGEIIYGVADINKVTYERENGLIVGFSTTSDNYIGLELLETYTPKMRNIVCNNSTIDFSRIPETSKNCIASANRSKFEARYGLTCSSQVSCKTLEKLDWTGFSGNMNLTPYCWGGGWTLDLSKSNITHIYGSQSGPNFNVIAPKGLRFIRWCVGDTLDLSKLDGSTSGSLIINFGWSSRSSMIAILSTLPDGFTLYEINSCSNLMTSDFSFFESLYNNKNQSKISINRIVIEVSNNTTCTSLYGLRYVDDLSTLTCSNVSNLNDLSEIEHLHLRNLTIKNGAVSSVYSLRFATTLVNLNLSYNCLFDTASFKDDDQNTVTINNLEILARLNTNYSLSAEEISSGYTKGNLTSLYLLGNSGIIDFSPVSKLSWTNKSGF